VKLAKEVNSSDAQGIFLSCTDLKTMTVLEELERDLGKPVISSNAASLWKSMKVLKKESKLTGKILGFGSLLERA